MLWIPKIPTVTMVAKSPIKSKKNNRAKWYFDALFAGHLLML